MSVPIELYTDERIAEFTRDEPVIAKLLGRPARSTRRGRSKS
jgi:hypothetical protein